MLVHNLRVLFTMCGNIDSLIGCVGAEGLSEQISSGGLGHSRNRELAFPPMLQLPNSTVTTDPHSTAGEALTFISKEM